MSTTTDSLTPELDARIAGELCDGFTEDQMHAIDRGVVKVYTQTRAILPPELLGAGTSDPAGALRAVAYEYALTHRADIDNREPWQITHHIAGRVQQYVKRAVKKRRELPYGMGERFHRAVNKAQAAARAESGTHKPRKYPARYWQNPSPYESEVQLDMFVRYGQVIPDDKAQFLVTGTCNGEPVFMEPETFAKLHTRKPTRREFWSEVCTERDRKKFRKQIAESFNLGICECPECKRIVK